MAPNLRIPMTLESREVRVSGGGSTRAYWAQWGGSTINGAYESDKPSLEGDLKPVESQQQEKRGGLITIRYHSELAESLDAKWRFRFSPMPGMTEETHKVRSVSFLPKEGRVRFLQIKVEREVK